MTKPGDKVLYRLIVFSWVFTLAVYLLIRNAQMSSEFIFAFRLLLSLSIGMMASFIPGTMNLSLNTSGIAIKATSGFALFAITFFVTPGFFDAIGINKEFSNKNIETKIIDPNGVTAAPDNNKNTENKNTHNNNNSINNKGDNNNNVINKGIMNNGVIIGNNQNVTN